MDHNLVRIKQTTSNSFLHLFNEITGVYLSDFRTSSPSNLEELANQEAKM